MNSSPPMRATVSEARRPLREPRRSLLQHLIAQRMPVRVIDVLEVVQIDPEHRDLTPIAPGLRDRDLQPLTPRGVGLAALSAHRDRHRAAVVDAAADARTPAPPSNRPCPATPDRAASAALAAASRSSSPRPPSPSGVKNGTAHAEQIPLATRSCRQGVRCWLVSSMVKAWPCCSATASGASGKSALIRCRWSISISGTPTAPRNSSASPSS